MNLVVSGAAAKAVLPPGGFRRHRALLVAIGDYTHGIPPLQTPRLDAGELARVLEELHGFEVELICDAEATSDAICARLEDLAFEMNGEDRAFIYFAGHGVALEGDAGPEGFLLAADAQRDDARTFLPMTRFNSALDRLPCRHLLAILDCCFAGAFRWASTRNLELSVEQVHQERFNWFIEGRAWQAIASAAHDQKALDVIAGEPLGARDRLGANSPFAAALIAGLKGAADRPRHDGLGDGIITATELFLHLEDSLSTLGGPKRFRQTPVFWPFQKHEGGQFVFLAPGHTLALAPAPPLSEDNSPWRGLEPYQPRHAEIFFGRGVVSDQLAGAVAEKPLVVVSGPSGIGKSSLILAGLLPRLPQGTQYLILRPGPAPLAALAAELGLGAAEAETFASDPTALAAAIERRSDPAPLVLVIDQAEELVTQQPSPEVKRQFLALLHEALRRCSDTLKIVVSIRSDFEPQFLDSDIGRLWLDARFSVPAMSRQELRRVIDGPAAVKVLRFDPPDLVEKLIDEVQQMPGVLPLLSFALSEMYRNFIRRRARDRTLTRQDYEALGGGVTGSLRMRANLLFDAFEQPTAETARRVLERLVSVEGGEFARRRVPRSDFESDDAGETSRADQVIDALLAARLAVGGAAEDGPYVELAHDALILGWDKLHQWVRTDARQLLEAQRLSRDAVSWERERRRRSALLWSNSARVATLRSLQRSHAIGLSRTEAAFARANIRRARINRALLVALLLAILVSAVAAIFNYLASETARELALNRRYAGDMASVARAWSSGDEAGARVILDGYAGGREEALRSFEWHLYRRTMTSGRPLFHDPGNSVLASAVSPDGNHLAFLSEDRPAIVVDLQSRKRFTLSAATTGARAIAYSATRSAFVIGGTGELRLWSVSRTQEIVLPLPGAQEVIALSLRNGSDAGAAVDEEGRLYRFDLGDRSAARFGTIAPSPGSKTVYSAKAVHSADGKTLLLANIEGALQLRDAATLRLRQRIALPQARLEGSWAAIDEIVMLPAGDRLAILDTRTGRVSLSDYIGDIVVSVAVRRDLIAVGGNWAGIELWHARDLRDPQTWEYVGVVRGFSGWPSSTLFLPRSDLLFATTLGGDAVQWTLSNAIRARVDKHNFKIMGLAQVPNGDVISADERGLIRRWNGKSRADRWRTFVGREMGDVVSADDEGLVVRRNGRTEVVAWEARHDRDIVSIAVASRLERVAVALQSSEIILLNSRTGAIAERMEGFGPLAASADGRHLAWIGGGRLWKLGGGSSGPVSLPLPAEDEEQSMESLALSPDGRLMAIGFGRGKLILVDAASGAVRAERVLAKDRIVWSIAFAPDGRTLAAGVDKAIHVVAVPDASDVASLVEHSDDVFSLAFSPDGKTLASGDRAGAIRLWNVKAWQATISIQNERRLNHDISYLSFSPAGDALMAGSESSWITIYSAAP